MERAGPADAMFAALQRDIPQQFGAVLALQPGNGFDPRVLTTALADRARGVPRLRQRLVNVPPGCGRPVWIDDPGFSIDRHIDHLVCPSPGDERALLDVAGRLIVRRLPMDRPLWHASVVTGLTDGRVAIVLVVQHALADGIGGLAVLRLLVDGAPSTARRPFPIPPPSFRQLAADALRSRAHAVRHIPERIRLAANEIRNDHGPRIGRAAACSLLAATGDQRRVAVVRAQVEDLRAVAHRHGATVNDVVLSAIGGALHTCLERRGEHVDAIVVGVPVGMRRTMGVQVLGNQLGEIRAAVTTISDPVQRLERVAKAMQVRKRATMRLSAASGLIRVMARLGFYGWYMRHQRYLHTVVTNVRGPVRRLTFCGAPIMDVLPLTVAGGNVTMTFAVLSYAGTVVVSAIADPDAAPDLVEIAAALQEELDKLTDVGPFASASRRLSIQPGR
jgi:diacylglycerol O-acyltransferase / wax synthase